MKSISVQFFTSQALLDTMTAYVLIPEACNKNLTRLHQLTAQLMTTTSEVVVLHETCYELV